MKVIMNSEEDLLMTDFEESGLDIEVPGEGGHYSALQMFITSMAVCTYSVLASYAEQIDTDTEGMSMHLRWDYLEDPFRIGHIDMAIDWPSLPPSRLKAAERAAAMCTIHNTLHQPPEIVTEVTLG